MIFHPLFAYIDPSSGYTLLNLGGWMAAFFLGSLAFFGAFFRGFLRFFRRKWKPFLLGLVLLAAAVSAIIGFMQIKPNVPAGQGKTVILGFDGMSPELVDSMIAAGDLPHFKALAEKGSYKRLATTNPAESPVAWSSFATGRNPGKTGVFDFIVRDPKTYGLSLSLSNIVSGKARRVVSGKSFWQYATDAKVPSVILGCPITFPPDAILGRMISGMGVPDILGTEGTFTYYTSAPIPKGEKMPGGRVVQVPRSPALSLELAGPRVSGLTGSHVLKHGFTVAMEGAGARITSPEGSFTLEPGRWSGWRSAEFKTGFFGRMKGIYRFYLVSIDPHFQLYVSPINFDPRQPYFPISHPADYSRELAEKIGLFHTAGMPMDTWALNEKRLTEKAFLEQSDTVLEERRRMLTYELGRFESGILFAYFENPDIIQHMFWRFRDPLHPIYEKEPPSAFADAIRDCYRKMDEIVGEVAPTLGEDDTLIVLSDHGMSSFRRAAHVNAWLRENGYLVLRGGKSSGPELFGDVDWSRTKAYAAGFGAIYVNQKGREGKGIVGPGGETESLKNELVERLTGWKDGETSVVKKVYRRQEIFQGPHADKAPDLYIGFAEGYQASWQTALGAAPDKLVEDNLKKWSGSHLFDPSIVPGILLTNRKVLKEDPSLMDLAPTILKAAGIDPDALETPDFDGKPLW